MSDGTSRWLERRETWATQPEDARDAFSIDHGRVVHSGSFRRLQGKTQILNLGESDFYRTRLTHTLEVAQIAGNLANQIGKDNPGHPCVEHLPMADLIQAIGLTHDLGHGGEVALNYCMRDAGGFEGNGQTLRILAKLEKFSQDRGANLTRRTMLGALKYPAAFSDVANPDLRPALLKEPQTLKLIDRKASRPPKCYLDCDRDAVDWILDPLRRSDRDAFVETRKRPGEHAKTLHKSLDCTIMDVADDIAYGVHDLEDALALRLVGAGDIQRVVEPSSCAEYTAQLATRYRREADTPEGAYSTMISMLTGDGGKRKRAIGRLVHYFVTHCEVETREAFEAPLLRYRIVMKPDARRFLDKLQALVKELVIKSPTVQQLEFKGQRMVVAVFEALLTEPEAFLPFDTRRTLAASSDGAARVICDHVSGMSDGFLLKTYERLFSPRMGSVFDKI